MPHRHEGHRPALEDTEPGVDARVEETPGAIEEQIDLFRDMFAEAGHARHEKKNYWKEKRIKAVPRKERWPDEEWKEAA